MSLFTSVEFYVVAVVIAAAIVAFSARPKAKGPARQFFLNGILTRDETEDGPQSVEFMAHDDGSVTLIRHGLRGLTEQSTVSLMIDVVGFDVQIQERVSVGKDSATSISVQSWPVDTATFTLDFLAPEYYHIQYSSPDLGLFMATTLHNRPGIHYTKQLQ